MSHSYCSNRLQVFRECTLKIIQYDDHDNVLRFVTFIYSRGHLETLIHAVHLLQHLEDQPVLPISNVLYKLLEMEGGAGPPSAMLGNRHIICWGFEDLLSNREKEAAAANAPPGGAGSSQSPPAGSYVLSIILLLSYRLI